MKKIISAIFGTCILGILFFLSSKSNTLPDPVSSNSVIGQKLNFEFVGNKPSGLRSKRIYAILSPNCPHCQNTLKYLSSNAYESAMDVDLIPVFKESISERVITDLFADEKVSFPVFRVKSNSIVKSFKYVPTFIYVEEGIVRNVIVGGALSENQFQILLKSLIRT